VKITVTEVARDGQLRRRMVDTTGRDDASRWEELAKRAAIGDPPVYRPAPGRPVFAIEVDDQEAMVAERDVTGPLGELVTAVMIEGTAE
jgi:hypothetical protein